MDFKNEIICKGRDRAEHKFLYSIEESEEQGLVKWIFRVMPEDLKAKDYYEFAVVIIGNNTGKIVMMDNRNMKEYRGKGITEKMIAEAKKALGVSIISSTNCSKYKALETEWRTDSATIIWERLRMNGKANYDEEKDIYTFIGS
jgi:hypothetical protein